MNFIQLRMQSHRKKKKYKFAVGKKKESFMQLKSKIQNKISSKSMIGYGS